MNVSLEYILLVLNCVSVTLLITRSKILEKFRMRMLIEYNTGFFGCGQCVGFHVGWMVYLLYTLLLANEVMLAPHFYFFIVTTALLSSMFSYFAVLIHDRLVIV